jgi:sigma-B regulation protein RsbU (phosphoserine phosphatase)
VYFILLTGKRQTEDLVVGMEAGADDFVVKPCNPDELKVRIRAGERIVNLEENLRNGNRKILEANERMQRDLWSAAQAQKTFLPSRSPRVPGFRFAWEFEPCSYVAGDLLNVFNLDENTWGFYVLDVSGHGVSAAMLSVTVAQLLSPSFGTGSLVKRIISNPPYYEIVSPEQVVKSLREQYPYGSGTGLYFTLTYALADTRTGKITWFRAGHTPPLAIQGDQKPVFHDEGGGLPVSFWPEDIVLTENSQSIVLQPGDRLYLYSDGVIEARNLHEELFSEERYAEVLFEARKEPLEESLRRVIEAARKWQGSDEFPDDVTILALERLGDAKS